MGSCSIKSSSSGKITNDNKQQVEVSLNEDTQLNYTLMLCELKNITSLLKVLVTHFEIITDEENIDV